MSQLDDARKAINQIDQEMATLFEERMKQVEAVIAYKKANGLPVLDVEREKYIIEHNLAYIKEEKYRSFYVEYMKQMMAISRRYQKSMLYHDVVGYQGSEGAFSYIASSRMFPDSKLKAYDSFEALFHAVDNNEVKYGVLPIQNNHTGEVGEVLDLLIQYNLYIGMDYQLRISQNLLGIKDAKLEDIKEVYSKDHAINQSIDFLRGRGYQLIAYPNTALAAQYVAQCNDKTKAAIGSKENASLYGLEILASDINTNHQNTTRFIVLSKELIKEGDTFALAIVVPDEPGSLTKAMQVISKHGFNMQMLISRPMKSRSWEYYFYVEIDGNINGEREQKMFKELESVSEKVKVLGSFNKRK